MIQVPNKFTLESMDSCKIWLIENMKEWGSEDQNMILLWSISKRIEALSFFIQFGCGMLPWLTLEGDSMVLLRTICCLHFRS